MSGPDRADEAHDLAVKALSRIDAHERECVVYRQQNERALERIERGIQENASEQKRALKYIIGALLGACVFLFLTLKTQGW